MKELIKILLLFFIISSQVFAIVGFGAYGNFDLIKYPEGTSGDLETSGVKYGGFNNATGFGLLFYIDAIPIVDLEADIEFIGNVYKYTPYVAGQPLSLKGEMPWGRVSTYLTARKEILGLSIPLLAKAQLYGGLGYNRHSVLPVMTVDLIESAFPSATDLDAALTESTSSDDQMEKLATYMLENIDKISGFHLQTGVRGKLLMFNAFVNARYTIAKDVIPGKGGFPSLWFGLALGI